MGRLRGSKISLCIQRRSKRNTTNNINKLMRDFINEVSSNVPAKSRLSTKKRLEGLTQIALRNFKAPRYPKKIRESISKIYKSKTKKKPIKDRYSPYGDTTPKKKIGSYRKLVKKVPNRPDDDMSC